MKISLMLGVLFMMSSQPMLMIGILMSLVIIYSLFIYLEIGSFWFGYILMLVLLSGVLVIFTYVISLIPNEGFEFLSSMFLMVVIFYLFISNYLYFMTEDTSFLCLLMWEGMLWLYLIYLVSFLLCIMVMVIYVSCPSFGALRLYLSAW